MASLVGAAPTCSDLKDRAQCCLRSATAESGDQSGAVFDFADPVDWMASAQKT